VERTRLEYGYHPCVVTECMDVDIHSTTTENDDNQQGEASERAALATGKHNGRYGHHHHGIPVYNCAEIIASYSVLTNFTVARRTTHLFG
jgi:hypothetical protein